MTKVGNIFTLFYTDATECKVTKELILDEKGVINDKHYNLDLDRSVLITSLDSYKLIKKSNIDVNYGSLGENILIDYNPYNLDIGSRFQVGSVILEISQYCTLCKSFAKLDSRLPKLLKSDRGIFAKVLEPGTINIDDIIYFLD